MNTKLQLPALHIPNGNPYEWKVRHTRPGNLVGYWPLNELSGTIAYDHSGNGFHGTYYGNPRLGQQGIGDGWTIPWFDGVDDYVNLFSSGLAAAFGKENGTVCIWLQNQIEAVAIGTAFSMGSPDPAPYSLRPNINMYGVPGSSLYHEVIATVGTNNTAGGTWDYLHSFSFISISWRWINSGSMNVYTLKNNQSASRTINSTPATSLAITRASIGNITGYTYWAKGILGHAGVWNETLSISEMRNLSHVY